MTHVRISKAKGIVLKRKNIGEADRIITIFTKEYGKKRFIGKGIRKVGSRRASHVEPFSEVDFLFYEGKTFAGITDVTAKKLYGTECKDLREISALYLVSEIIDQLIPEEQRHEDVYNLFLDVLYKLTSREQKDVVSIITAFIHTLLFILGYGKSDTDSDSFPDAIGRVEGIIERRLQSTKLLTKTFHL